MTDIDVRPLHAPLGAIVRGITFDAPLREEHRHVLLRALAEHHLLVLRGHHAPPADGRYRDFGLRFGPLRPSVADLSRLPDHPEINLVSNTVEAGGVQGTGGAGVIDWHADMNFDVPATDYIVLDALELPSRGGNTRFANLVAAYDALDEPTRAHIELLEVRYTFRQDLEYARLSDEHRRSLRGVVHPLVQCRFPSRRRSLWPNVGIFDGEVLGHPGGAALLEALLAHATDDRFVYEHEWQPGDLVLWSNWSVFHRREAFDPAERRVMRHLTVSEGGPVLLGA